MWSGIGCTLPTMIRPTPESRCQCTDSGASVSDHVSENSYIGVAGLRHIDNVYGTMLTPVATPNTLPGGKAAGRGNTPSPAVLLVSFLRASRRSVAPGRGG